MAHGKGSRAWRLGLSIAGAAALSVALGAAAEGDVREGVEPGTMLRPSSPTW